MKLKLKQCNRCEEETLHDVGKKQATSKRGGYTRRKTSRCRSCGTREIDNIKQKQKKVIIGKNQNEN